MTGMYFMLDALGEPVATDADTWSRWFQTGNRTLAKTHVGDTLISTVFLGLDHGFGGRPLLWETLVFGGPLDGEMNRYQTRQQAMMGHELLCQQVRDAQRRGARQIDLED